MAKRELLKSGEIPIDSIIVYDYSTLSWGREFLYFRTCLVFLMSQFSPFSPESWAVDPEAVLARASVND